MSWWLAHAQRTLSEDVPAPPGDVRDFYVDLNNIKLVHPLIVSVQATSRTETPEGYLQSYRVVDRIPLGPLTIKTAYRARLHVRADGDVATEADQSPGVHLRGIGELRADPGASSRHPDDRANCDQRAPAIGRADDARGGQGAHRDAGRHPAPLRIRVSGAVPTRSQRGFHSEFSAVSERYFVELQPPSTTIVWPLMNAPAGEHKNATVFATSSTVPKR